MTLADRPGAVDSRRLLVVGVTFVVAFCSIAYELVYSELLRVFFGGTVVRYSITIGLFLSSLGVGAFLYNYFDPPDRRFFHVEVALAAAGPLGLVYVFALNVLAPIRPPVVADAVLVASHLPVVAVGVLSGTEIPFLTRLFRGTDDVAARGTDRDVESGSAPSPEREPAPDGGRDTSAFSTVLGIDYVGSLAGTVVWALVLYPTLGLVPAVFLLGLLNAAAALVFYAWYAPGARVALVVCLLLTASYVGALAADDRVEETLTDAYLSDRIEEEYPPGAVDVTVSERFTTRYQEVFLYERDRQQFDRPETCLRLDMQLQLCDSWVASYHTGLVDVPMTAFENPRNRSVLVVGGGDWIAVDRLRAYGVQVDQVDLDGEFMDYTKSHPFFRQYHDDAYRYDRLNVTVGDAYTYLQRTDREYDLVLLDLPGARSDDLLPVYSVEFYQLLRSHLTDDGFVVTWRYSPYQFTRHNQAYLTTVRAAGFEYHREYSVRDDLRDDPGQELGEGFYLFSPDSGPSLSPNRSERAAVRRHPEWYTGEWDPIPEYRGVRPNSVFHPNYDIIVGRRTP